VEVQWPSGTITTVENPEINTTVTLVEADCLFDAEPITTTGDVVLCPGETIDLTAPAGYEYNWNQDMGSSQTITVSEAGNYYVVLNQVW